MSLPNEIQEQLLSGYLDDALTAEERAHVDEMLLTPEIALELQSMRELRGLLKTIDRADRPGMTRVKLGDSFASRVIDAAIEIARTEGVSEDHPLVRLSETPATQTTSTSRPNRWAYSLFALAASGLIGVVVMRGINWSPSANPGIQLASNANPTPSDLSSGSSSAMVVDAPAANDFSPAFASNEPANVIAEVASSLPVAADQSAALEKTENKLASNTPAMSDRTVIDANPSQNTRTKPVELISKTPVLVYHVRRTEHGSLGNPIAAAMREAAVEPNSQKTVSRSMVQSVSSAVSALGDSGTDSKPRRRTVIYLEAPARRIDHLLLALLADTESIESVQLSIAIDTPLSTIVQTVGPEAARATKQPFALEFTNELQDAGNALAGHFSRQTFSPVTRATIGFSGLDSATKDGLDFPSRVFLLVE